MPYRVENIREHFTSSQADEMERALRQIEVVQSLEHEQRQHSKSAAQTVAWSSFPLVQGDGERWHPQRELHAGSSLALGRAAERALSRELVP